MNTETLSGAGQQVWARVMAEAREAVEGLALACSGNRSSTRRKTEKQREVDGNRLVAACLCMAAVEGGSEWKWRQLALADVVEENHKHLS